MMLVAEGLPLARRERGTGDLIAGEAFLSMLLGRGSRYREAPSTTTTTTTTTTTAVTPTTTAETEEPTTFQDVIRETRSSPYRTFALKPSDNPLSQVSSDLGSYSEQSSDGMIVSVSMSSSSRAAAPSEQRAGVVAEANKSALEVDEGGPITYNYQQHGRARSVSYSSLVQTIPQPKKNATEATSSSAAETKDYYVTSKYNPPDYNDSLDKRQYETTERNWGIPERTYPQKNPYTPVVYAQPEQNYEVDEAVSVETNGRAHGVQPSRSAESKKKDDNQKVGYVVEGRNYRKYRVEERTSDGFIVGEYGVVSHDDGSLRGVRYTADGTISPRLIYDALMKFLSL